MAGYWAEQIDQGADVEHLVVFEDDDGVYLELTDYDFVAELRKVAAPGEAAATFSCTVIDHPDPNDVVGNEDPTDRALRIVLTDTQTAALVSGDYNFELWTITSDGIRTLTFAGTWTVKARGGRAS